MNIKIDRISVARLLCALGRGGGMPYMLLGISTMLAVRAPQVTTWRELADSIYGDDPNGGPLDARNCIVTAVCTLRKRGVPIRTEGWRGYYLARIA